MRGEVWSPVKPLPAITFPKPIEELIASLGIPASIIEESARSPNYSSAKADADSFTGYCPTLTVS